MQTRRLLSLVAACGEPVCLSAAASSLSDQLYDSPGAVMALGVNLAAVRLLAEAAELNIKSLGRVMHYERRRALAGGVYTCVISTDYLHEVLRTCATFRARRYASRVQKLLHKSNDQLIRLLIMAKIVCADHTGVDHLSRPLPVDKLGKPSQPTPEL